MPGCDHDLVSTSVLGEMNGHDRNMFWQSHRPQSASMILLSIVLLTLINLASTAVPCNQKTFCKTLNKGLKFAKLMNRTTGDLIELYQANQGDFARQFCNMAMENVPSSNLLGETFADRVVNTYTRLKEFLPHMKKVLEQQKDLQPPLCPLLADLDGAVLQTSHLANMMNCMLQIVQPNVPIPEPVAPTGIPLPQNVFQQKVYGCVVLTRLNKFLSRVISELGSHKGMCIRKSRRRTAGQ